MSAATTIALSEAVEFINGDRGKNYPDRDAQRSSGYCLFLNTKNVRQGYFDFSEVVFIDEERHRKLGGGTLSRNDIVLTIRGTLGNTAVYRENIPFDVVRINSAMLALRPKRDFDPDFIERYLRSWDFLSWVGLNQRGSAQPHLRTADIEIARLPLVPIQHQRRVVTKIDSLSEKSKRARDHLDHIPRLVEKYKQAVLAAAFRGDLTKALRTERHLKSAYRNVVLKDVLADIRYGTAKKCDYEGGTTPVLRIPNVQRGEITLDDLKSADFDTSEVRKLCLQPGDVLLIRSNGSLGLVGRCAVVDAAAAGMLFAGYLIRLRFDIHAVLPKYVHLWFHSAPMRSIIEGLAKSTSGVNNINSTQIEQLPITLPYLDEQREIIRRIEIAFAWIDRLTTEAIGARRLVDRLDQAVLAKAFQGELVRQDPTDESASILLERIKAERDAAPTTKRGKKAKASA